MFSVDTIEDFEKKAERLIRKYPSLKSEIKQLITSLSNNPNQGTPIGKNCYKIRLAIRSKGKGKSGGARVITNFYVLRKTVYLLTIYDKSEQPDITDKDLSKLIEKMK